MRLLGLVPQEKQHIFHPDALGGSEVVLSTQSCVDLQVISSAIKQQCQT